MNKRKNKKLKRISKRWIKQPETTPRHSISQRQESRRITFITRVMETVIIRHILRTNSRDSKSISLIRIKSWTHNKFNSLIHNKITISITTTTTLVTMLWVISQIKWVVLTFHRLQTNIHINLCTSLIM